jgi:hypothetical protein
MPQTCGIRKHPGKQAIEDAILRRVPLARHVQEATLHFDQQEIERLKALCSRVFDEAMPQQRIGPFYNIDSPSFYISELDPRPVG